MSGATSLPSSSAVAARHIRREARRMANQGHGVTRPSACLDREDASLNGAYACARGFRRARFGLRAAGARAPKDGGRLAVAEVAGVVERSASKVGHWYAWTCDHDRLLRLAGALQVCVVQLRERARAGDVSFKDVKDEDFDVRLEARHKDLSMKERGSPEAVLETLDPSGMDSMVLTVGILPRQVVVTSNELVELDLPPTLVQTRSGEAAFFTGVSFSKSRGIGLHVRGCDPKWVRSTYTELESEIKKALPWWRFMRSGHMWWLYAGFAALMASTASRHLCAVTMSGGWRLR